MSNGGFIEFKNAPSTISASGVWSIREQLRYNRDEAWYRDIPDMPQGSLVLHLDANDPLSYSGSGSTWNDVSGNSNNGTLNNSPTFNTNYFTFNGTSQEVTTTTSFTSASSLTIFALFKTSSASGKKIIGFQNTQTGTTQSSYDRHLYVDTSGFLRFGMYDTATRMAISPFSVTDNTWRLATATYGSEGTTMRLYINEASVATATSSTSSYTGWWRIAGYALSGWANGLAGYFPGDIAVAGAYHRALSSGEITQIYNRYKNIYSLS